MVRFLDDAILRLLSTRDWVLPYDHRRIAIRLDLPTRHVKPAIERLLDLGRLQIVDIPADLSPAGNVQIGLELPNGDSLAVAGSEPSQSSGRAVAEHSQTRIRTESETNVAALIKASLDSRGPSPGQAVDPLTRARAEETKTSLSNGSGPRDHATANAIESNELVNRIIALVARGRPQSIAVLRYEAAGLPDYILARAIESYRGRQPRPANGAGYFVATLRHLRAESGLPDTRPRIEREPPL